MINCQVKGRMKMIKEQEVEVVYPDMEPTLPLVGTVRVTMSIILPHGYTASLTREEAERLYESLGDALGKTPPTAFAPTYPNPIPWGQPRTVGKIPFDIGERAKL